MNSELSFLIDLLMKNKLPPAAKDLVAQRIQAIADGVKATQSMPIGTYTATSSVLLSNQSPSTQAILARNPDLAAVAAPPQPVAVIAQTPAAVAAINARNQTIAQAMSGKPEKGQTSPRKF